MWCDNFWPFYAKFWPEKITSRDGCFLPNSCLVSEEAWSPVPAWSPPSLRWVGLLKLLKKELREVEGKSWWTWGPSTGKSFGSPEQKRTWGTPQLDPKLEKESENEFPGAAPKKSKTESKKSQNRLFFNYFDSFSTPFSTLGAPGPRGAGTHFRTLFPTLGPEGPNDPCSRARESQALGVIRPFSELSQSSEEFLEQLSEFRDWFSECEIPFPEWHLTTWAMRKTTVLGATPGAILGIDGNPHERFSLAPPFSEFFFKNWGCPPTIATLRDAVFLLTVGSFLLTVQLFYLQLTILAFLLTIGAFSHTFWVFLLTVGAFCLLWESASNKRHEGL